MEFAVLAAGVDPGRQVAQEVLVEGLAHEGYGVGPMQIQIRRAWSVSSTSSDSLWEVVARALVLINI